MLSTQLRRIVRSAPAVRHAAVRATTQTTRVASCLRCTSALSPSSLPSARSFASSPNPYAAGATSGPVSPPPDGSSDAGWQPQRASQSLADIDLSKADPPLAKHKQHGYVVYTSPFEGSVKALKMLSLTSALMSIASAPVVVFLAENQMPLPGRLAIAGTVLIFGLSTTAALTHFLKSYVIRIFARLDPNAPVSSPPSTPLTPEAERQRRAGQQYVMTVQTLNMLSRPVYMVARHCDFSPLHSRMFNNVRVAGRDLFVHMDVADHPLLLPMWHKEVVVQAKPTIIEQITEENQPTDANSEPEPEVRISREQARMEIRKEEHARAMKMKREQIKSTQPQPQNDKKNNK